MAPKRSARTPSGRPLRSVAVVNQKGGVGKTAVVLGLAMAARRAGHRALVVDLDPQGSATWCLGVDADDDYWTSADVMEEPSEETARNALVTSGWGDEVDVVAASAALVREDGGDPLGKVQSLAPILGALAPDYDLVVVDCAPSLGAITNAALGAVHGALAIAEPSALSRRGLGHLRTTIDAVSAEANPDLSLVGVLLNRVPARSAEAARQREALAEEVGKRAMLTPELPTRVIVNEAMSSRRPLDSFGARTRDLVDRFDRLHRTLVRRLG
ncbi:MAG: ParA family protein [Microthrixaceae bacterium]